MAVAFVAQAVTIGLTIIPFGLFATPLVEEFGLSIASVQVGLGLFIVVLTGTSAGIGPLLDRYSIRLFMALGFYFDGALLLGYVARPSPLATGPAL